MSVTGLGAVFEQENGSWIVKEVSPGGSIKVANELIETDEGYTVEEGDVLIGIDGVTLAGKDIGIVQQNLAGEEGTAATLHLERPPPKFSDDEPFRFQIHVEHGASVKNRSIFFEDYFERVSDSSRDISPARRGSKDMERSHSLRKRNAKTVEHTTSEPEPPVYSPPAASPPHRTDSNGKRHDSTSPGAHSFQDFEIEGVGKFAGSHPPPHRPGSSLSQTSSGRRTKLFENQLGQEDVVGERAHYQNNGGHETIRSQWSEGGWSGHAGSARHVEDVRSENSMLKERLLNMESRLYDAEQRLSARTGIIDRVEMLEDRLVQAETTALTKANANQAERKILNDKVLRLQNVLNKTLDQLQVKEKELETARQAVKFHQDNEQRLRKQLQKPEEGPEPAEKGSAQALEGKLRRQKAMHEVQVLDRRMRDEEQRRWPPPDARRENRFRQASMPPHTRSSSSSSKSPPPRPHRSPASRVVAKLPKEGRAGAGAATLDGLWEEKEEWKRGFMELEVQVHDLKARLDRLSEPRTVIANKEAVVEHVGKEDPDLLLAQSALRFCMLYTNEWVLAREEAARWGSERIHPWVLSLLNHLAFPSKFAPNKQYLLQLRNSLTLPGSPKLARNSLFDLGCCLSNCPEAVIKSVPLREIVSDAIGYLHNDDGQSSDPELKDSMPQFALFCLCSVSSWKSGRQELSTKGVDSLIKVLAESPDVISMEFAAAALANCALEVEGAGRAVSAVPLLCKHLNSPRRALRRNALMALNNLAKHAKLARVMAGQRNVTDKLRALCNSPDKEERKHAETAMRRLGD